MQLYFAVPDTATTHEGVLVRSFLRQCAVSRTLPGQSSSGVAAFLRTVCPCWQTGASFPGRCSPLRCRRKGMA